MNKKLDTKLGHGSDNMRPKSLVKNKDTYYFRCRIPSHLQETYHPKKEIKFSLQTKDESIALVKVAEAEAHYQREFYNATRKLEKTSKSPDGALFETDGFKPELTDEVQLSLQRKYLYDQLVWDADLHKVSFNSEKSSLLQNDTNQYVEVAEFFIKHILEGENGNKKFLAITEYKNIEEFYLLAEIFCARVNIDFNHLTDIERRSLTRHFLMAERDFALELRQRLKGNFRAIDEIVSKEKIFKLPKTTWSEVFNYWKNESDSRTKSIEAYFAEFENFRKFLKNKPIEQVTHHDATNYKTHLNKQDLTTKTKNKRLSFLKTIFSKAFRNRILEINALDIDLLKDKSRDIKRYPFSADDLEMIFGSDIYTKGFRPNGGGGEASYWVPVIAYYTGARLEEICQLRKENVKFHEKCGYYFQILNIDEDGKKVSELKNKFSIRNVPIHNDLIEAGLLSYVETVKSEFIFPDLTLRQNSPQRSVNFTKWFMRYLRAEIGIKSRLKVFHSFRHTFYAMCDNADISDGLRDDLVGHKKTNVVSRAYKDVRSLETLRHAMDKIETLVNIPKWTPPHL